jgi:symplekin
VEDEDEYEPDFFPVEDSEQVRNRIEMESSEDLGIGIPSPSELQSMTFSLPDPQPLRSRDLELYGRVTMDIIFRKIEQATLSSSTIRKRFNRFAASSDDKDARVTTFARLLTRPSAGLPDQEDDDGLKPQVLCDRGRTQLLNYIMSNWKARMDVATTWLTEEWYNDQVVKEVEELNEAVRMQNFQKWIHRFLDDLSAFIGAEDSKLLIRFVSEIPGLDRDIISKIKRLALDPERITMVVNAIQ